MPYPPTEPAPFDSIRTPRRVTFDPTINLGHVLTAAAMLMAGFAGWSALDRRVAVLEVSATATASAQRERDAAQDQRLRDSVEVVKESIQRIERTLDGATKGR